MVDRSYSKEGPIVALCSAVIQGMNYITALQHVTLTQIPSGLSFAWVGRVKVPE